MNRSDLECEALLSIKGFPKSNYTNLQRINGSVITPMSVDGSQISTTEYQQEQVMEAQTEHTDLLSDVITLMASDTGTGCERRGVKSANGNGLKMKLRDFMVNSLPRVRSRKKQKQQQQQQQQLLLQQQQHENRSPVLNNGDLDENRNTYSAQSDFIPSSDDVNDHYYEPLPFKRVSTESIRSELEELIIEKSHFVKKTDPINVNITTDCSDNKCLCFKHMTNSYGPNDVVLGLGLGHCGDEDGPLSLDALKDAFNFNTVPKVRSKIRTNPWCNPATPTNSPASSPSPNSFFSTSPSISPTEYRLLQTCDSPAVSEMSTSSYSTGSAHGSEGGIRYTSSFSTVEKPRCINPQYKQTFYESTKAGNVISIKIPGSDEAELVYGGKDKTESDEIKKNNGGLPTDKTTETQNQNCVLDEHLEHKVSFQYEQTLETLLESGKVKSDSFASIQDLYDDMADDGSNFSLGSIGSGSLSDEFPVCDMTDSGHSSGRGSLLEAKSPTCYSFEGEFSNMNFREDSDDDEADLGFCRRGDCLSDSASSANGDTAAWLSPESSESSVETVTPHTSFNHGGSSRSLHDVKASLEEKVLRLRREKLLVEEKIREAQEEDRIRAREKVRFQKQMTLHRKQMLLQTLQELKNKLEQQGVRLQTSYSTILNIQRKFAQKNLGAMNMLTMPQ